MAKAELQYKTHTRQVHRTVVDTEEVQKVSGVVLTLTKREARVLRTICGNFIGNEKTTLRGVVNNIWEALEAAGVPYYRGVTVEPYYFTQDSLAVADEVDRNGDSEVPVKADSKPKLKVGDRVRIVRKVESFSNGWDNTWEAPEMDQYINNGRVYTIARISDMGVRFEEDGGYGWPEAALELVH